ncbi:MAG: glycerophosphoryl diester phosphodiesterase membrane domain-containing protein [Myxococcota bacterium]
MEPDSPGASSISVGGVLSRTLAVTRTNFRVLCPTLALLFLPSLILGFIALGMSPAPSPISPALALFYFFESVLGMVLWYVSQGAAIVIAVESMTGATPELGESIRKGLARLGPLLAVGFIEVLGVGLGMLLCFVPGIIVMAAWALAIPIAVMETRSATESLKRSWELTRGYRVQIFVAVFGLVLLMTAVSFGITIGTVGWEAFVDPAAAQTGTPRNWLSVLANYANSVFWGMILSVLAAVFYIDIKNEKEGVDVATLTSVFE